MIRLLCVVVESATPVFRIEWHARLILHHNRLFNCSRLLTDCFTRLTGVFISPPPDSTDPGMNPHDWTRPECQWCRLPSVLCLALRTVRRVVCIHVNMRSYCQWTQDTADFPIDNRWLSLLLHTVRSNACWRHVYTYNRESWVYYSYCSSSVNSWSSSRSICAEQWISWCTKDVPTLISQCHLLNLWPTTVLGNTILCRINPIRMRSSQQLFPSLTIFA